MRRFFFAIFLMSFSLNAAAYNQVEYPPITPENVMNLQEVEVLGNGAMNGSLAWLPDGGIVVGDSQGIYIYENLQAEARFIELGIDVQSLLFAGETLFFSDGSLLYAYDLAHEQILYSLEGQEPLAVSNQSLMLAYEVGMGVHVLEISTGIVLYDLSYEGILETEYSSESYSLENDFVFAQFPPNDEDLIVRWVQHSYDDHWEGGYMAGSHLWTLSESPQASEIEYELMSYSWDFAALDANWNPFSINDSSIHSANGNFSLGLQADEIFEAEYVNFGNALQGNFFAASILKYRNEGDVQSTTKIWDVTTGELVAHVAATGRISFSPDTSKVAIGRQIFELATGELLRELRSNSYEVLHYLTDRILQYAQDGSFRLLDAVTGTEIAVLPIYQDEWTKRFSLRTDGSLFFTHQDGGLIRYDAVTGAEIYHISDFSADFDTFTFSQNARYLFASGNGQRRLWDIARGESLNLPEQYQLTSPYFTASGALIVWNESALSLDFYEFSDASILASFPVDPYIYNEHVNPPLVLLSNDERYLLLSEANTGFNLWSLESLTLISNIQTRHWSSNMSADSAYLAYTSAENEISILRLADASIENRFTIPYTLSNMHFVSATVLYVGEAYYEEIPHTYNIFTGEEVSYPATDGYLFAEVANMYFYQEGETIRVESRDGEFIGRLDTGSMIFPSLSGDAKRLYLQRSDGIVSIWAVEE